MESFSQILYGEQYLKKINKDAIRLLTKDFTIYFGKDWSHNATVIFRPGTVVKSTIAKHRTLNWINSTTLRA